MRWLRCWMLNPPKMLNVESTKPLPDPMLNSHSCYPLGTHHFHLYYMVKLSTITMRLRYLRFTYTFWYDSTSSQRIRLFSILLHLPKAFRCHTKSRNFFALRNCKSSIGTGDTMMEIECTSVVLTCRSWTFEIIIFFIFPNQDRGHRWRRNPRR